MRAAAVRGSRRHWSTRAAAAALALLLALFAATEARAAELVYWDNLTADPGTIGVANVNTGAASSLNTAGAAIDDPAGMSYDPVTSRLYVASEGNDRIAYVNLDGSGGGTFPVPAAAPVEDPRGVVVDPVARIVYWINTPFGGSQSISWARLDGSEGGVLGTTPATLSGARRLALDPLAGRVYWGSNDGAFGYAPLVGRGGVGGTLEAESAGGPITGLSVDSVSSRIFWVAEGVGNFFVAGLGGTTVEAVNVGTAPISAPQGLAFDPVLGRLYWANSGNASNPLGAIGFLGLTSEPGGIDLTGAAVDSPQDPVVIKSPTSTGQPTITSEGRQLNCSQGSWAPDYASSFAYQSPSSYSYQWLFNEVPIAGAADPGYTAGVSGRYKCVVTASNPAGSTSRTSLGVVVTITTRPGKVTSTPAKLLLAKKTRRLKARPGDRVTMRVQIANQGTVASTAAKLCLKLTRKAKRALNPGECVQLGPIAGGGAANAKLRLRVKQRARPGAYELRIALPGAATKVIVKVLG